MRFSEFVEFVRPAVDVALSEMPSSVASVARWALEDEELHCLGGAVLGLVAGEVLRRMGPEAMQAWEEMCAPEESVAESWHSRSWG